jgi:hypothetical protein
MADGQTSYKKFPNHQVFAASRPMRLEGYLDISKMRQQYSAF